MNNEIKSLVAEIKDLVAQKTATVEAEKKSQLEETIEEMKSNLATMEKQMYRVNAGSSESTQGSEEVKAFDSFLRTNNSSGLLHKYLRTDQDPAGGYLVPQDMHNEIIHQIIEISDFRRLARVVNITGKSLDVNTNESDMTVYAVGEGGQVTESQNSYGRIVIPAHKMMAKAVITRELLTDSAYDIITELNTRAAQKFAAFEGAAFMSGNGVDRAQGILNAANVTSIASGDANLLTADAFWNMLGAFPAYQNPTFIMSRATYIAARKLKNGQGDYLLDEGLNGNPNLSGNGVAGRIAGVPVVLMQDMPSVAAGNVPVVLGDFKEAYMIVDRAGIEMHRDDVTLRDNDQVKFNMDRRVGGAVVNPNALIKMTIAAS